MPDRRPASSPRRLGRARGAALALAAAAAPAFAVDLAALWDFSRPDLTEQRLRAALPQSSGEDRLVLRTQIARARGLQGDFDGARAELAAIEPALAAAGAEARARFFLERGRTRVSAAHDPVAVDPADRAAARDDYAAAERAASDAGLDALAVDALHMMAFAEPAPGDALRWTRRALERALASPRPDARRWEASLRHNLGRSLLELGRHDAAIAEFRQALAVRERTGGAAALRDARWTLGWALREAGRLDEALALQSALDRAATAAGSPDDEVLGELEAIHRARGDIAAADGVAARRAGARR